jgi:hypothetical protein
MFLLMNKSIGLILICHLQDTSANYSTVGNLGYAPVNGRSLIMPLFVDPIAWRQATSYIFRVHHPISYKDKYHTHKDPENICSYTNVKMHNLFYTNPK